MAVSELLDVIMVLEVLVAALGLVFGMVNHGAVYGTRQHLYTGFRGGAVVLVIFAFLAYGLWITYALATGLWQFIVIFTLPLALKMAYRRIGRTRGRKADAVAIVPAKIGTVILCEDRVFRLDSMQADSRFDTASLMFVSSGPKYPTVVDARAAQR